MNSRLIVALLSAVIFAPAITAAAQEQEQLRPSSKPLPLEEIRARKIVVPETKQPHGCSIPTIDISHIKAFQIEVDRDPKQYLGHTTTAMLEDGKTIFLVYPTGHASGKIILKRSDDGGKTWSNQLPTPQSWNKIDNCPTLFRTVDKFGKRRLVLLAGMAVVKRAYSEDDGKTWSELVPISDWGGIVAMSSLVPLSGLGRYMALYHDYCGMEMGIMGPFMGASMKRRYRCGEDGGANGFIQFKVYTERWRTDLVVAPDDQFQRRNPSLRAGRDQKPRWQADRRPLARKQPPPQLVHYVLRRRRQELDRAA